VKKARMTKRDYTLLCDGECVNKSDEIKVENMESLCARSGEWKHTCIHLHMCKIYIYI